MCGFVGFSQISSPKEKETIVQNMLAAIKHRGPDSQQSYCDEDVAFGFARLSIIDLEGGTQPLFNEDRSMVLVFNGEIYNYQLLRKELLKKGHIFTTHTDSEVLLHGYEEWGAKILPRLRGMFAFTIWDKKEKKLFGARDHFGIKPYYYAQSGGAFFFGSEIKGFLPHPNFHKELNEDCLPSYLTFACVPGYDTFFKSVYKLPPAHYYEYQSGKMKVTRYFTPRFEPNPTRTMEMFAEDIDKTFEASVKAHRIADVEVGCFLSSGVDSSYVAYELSQQQKVKTYTIGFAEKEYSEADNAKLLADELGLENVERRVTGEEYFKHIGDVQYHLDEPLGNPSANLLYFVSERAAEDIKVVLSGEGADEMFGGYNVYKEPLAMKKYRKVPRVLRHMAAGAAKILPNFKGKSFLVRGVQPVEERYIGNSNVFPIGEREKYLNRQYNSKRPQYYTKPFYDEVKGLDEISKMQYMDIHVWMVQEILLKADKMSMAHSLELRVPFLDVEVFDLARTLPVEDKVSEENTKLALRAAAGKHMNRDSALRRKMAFPLPLPEWLREEKNLSIVRRYFESDFSQRFFDTKRLTALLDDHVAGKPLRSAKIWTILSFLVWYEEFFIKR